MELDVLAGKLGAPRLAAASPDSSFLAIHPSREFLYAVNESGAIQGRRDGGVSAFAIDQTTGTLELLNQQLPAGSGPCHLVVDRQGQNVLVANYGSGSVGCLPIERDGRLRPATSVIQHKGQGADPGRQTGPHAHSINLDAANRYAFAADLGLDEVFIYAFNPAKGQLTPHEPPFARVSPASGPRHFAFHPEGRFGYLINEMADTVTAFAYDADAGTLNEMQTISTLPADFKGKSYTAEVQVHPTGKFLYGSNRGHDSIAIFAIDPTSGKLTLVGIEPTQGKNPRNFAIDPTGALLFAENHGFEQHRRLPHRPAGRHPQAHRPDGEGRQAGLHQDDAPAREHDAITPARFDAASDLHSGLLMLLDSRQAERPVAGLAVEVRVDPAAVVTAVLADGVDDRLAVDDRHAEWLARVWVDGDPR